MEMVVEVACVGTGAFARLSRDGLRRGSGLRPALLVLCLPAQQLNSMRDKRRHGLQ
jgi:hypothetical protein